MRLKGCQEGITHITLHLRTQQREYRVNVRGPGLSVGLCGNIYCSTRQSWFQGVSHILRYCLALPIPQILASATGIIPLLGFLEAVRLRHSIDNDITNSRLIMSPWQVI